jgi:molecular chaperone DnaJ
MVVDKPCPDCDGSGHGKSTKTVTARIPAGVTDGSRIRLKGKGAAGEAGGPTGDLYIVVHVSADPLFSRAGDHVNVTVPITFTEAALGAEVAVPLPRGGQVKLKLPPGTANGRTFRVRGKGAGRRDGTSGDLLAKVEVVVPRNLNDAARAALASFAEAVGEPDPRADILARAAASRPGAPQG